MTRPFIVVGDKTSHGGTVISGAPTAITHNKPIARVGDKVTCPKCGSNTIATGDGTMIVMGQPVSRHGDKTACGATLIASQSVTVDASGGGAAPAQPMSFGEMFFANDTDDSAGQTASSNVAAGALASPVTADTEPEKRTGYHYRPIAEQAYHIRQFARLPIEGIGINGTYAIDGYITMKGNTLTVSAMGMTAAAQRGTVRFQGDATVTQGGKTVAEQKFTLSGSSTWPGDVVPLGTVTIQLPTPTSASSVELTIEGGYVYSSSAGSVAPLPRSTHSTFTLYVDADTAP